MLQRELHQLMRLHRQIMSNTPDAGLFRTHDVFCVAKTGQKIRFAPHAAIEGSLMLLLEKFIALWQSSQDKAEIARAIAYLWFGLIAIHPFSDGNGRVGKAFVKSKLAEKGFLTIDENALDAILITGQTEQDLKNLTEFFSVQLIS
jgi:Fic family protein